jgi:hypothetical protein
MIVFAASASDDCLPNRFSMNDAMRFRDLLLSLTGGPRSI